MFSSGPNYTKLKTNLRLTINRLKHLESKKTELALKSRKEIADYLSAGKEDRARIRVEHIVREDYYVEAMEMIEMYCDLLLARHGLIETQKELDPGLEEPVATILWATPRLLADCAELKVVSNQLAAKYGKEFLQSCKSNEFNKVNEKVMHRLSVQSPPRELIENYLDAIAKSFKVSYTPDPNALAQDVLVAEGTLIDFNDRRNNDGGGGGNNGVMQPMAPNPIPQQPNPYTNPNPNIGFAYSNQAPAMPAGQAPPFTMPGSQPPPPSFSTLYDNKPPAVSQPPAMPPSAPMDELPELPSVPGSTLPAAGTASGGGEDVDFDDLTRRFEELKRKK